MPPKRPASARTPPLPKKRAKSAQVAQSTIDSFFTSPTKLKTNAVRPRRENSVISISDSDDGRPGSPTSKADVRQAKADEILARELAKQWGKERPTSSVKVDKGKGRASSTAIDEVVLKGEHDDDIRSIDAAYPACNGVNGSSSSRYQFRPDAVKEEHQEEKDIKPVAAMFGKLTKESTPPLLELKPKLHNPATPGKSAAITSISTEAVDPIDFDTDAFLFRPSDIDTSKWLKGRLPYSVLVGVYLQVSSTRSRLFIVRVLTNFLHLLLHASPQDLPPSLYLLSNHLLPSYLPCELGIGSQILSKTIQEVSGCQPRDLKKLWEKWGDPGDVAYEAKNNLRTLVKPSPLLVHDVYNRLLGLSKIKGNQSGKVKGDVVRKLMVQARGEEVRFLVRSMIGNLRIGAVRLTLLTALARATALLHMPADLTQSVRPIPPPPAKAEKGQKRPPRLKAEPDPAREEVEARCVDAMKIVRRVYVRHPNYGDLVRGLEGVGLDGLHERVPVNVGVPLSPMLGSITRSLQEVFTRLGALPYTAEAKLDGQRVQIHARLNGPQGEDDGGGRWVQAEDGTTVWVRLFSRHLEDMTEKYPDVCQLFFTLLTRPIPASPGPLPSSASEAPRHILDLLRTSKIESLIMDAEVVAVDKDSGAYRTFQDLTNRAKKDVRVEDIKVVVGIFAFDLMLLNDTPLLESPFSHRRHLLRTLFPPVADPSNPALARFAHVDSLDSTTCTDPVAEMQAFFETVVEQKCEGLMVKLLESGEGLVGEGEEGDVDDGSEVDETPKKKGKLGGVGGGGKKKPLPATYEPDQRSMGWMKVKKDYLEGLGDSLDLVPIGAWWGQGRKAGWWSPFLLACHNPETGALEAVCKCISGFTDAFYKDMLIRFPPHNALPEKCNTDQPLGYYETNGLRPDVWFEPREVWEMRGADITLSPVYPAAASLLGSERGLSVRFPRFIKRREDKSWEQATTSEQFADMYRKQTREAPARGQNAGAGERHEVIRRRESEERDNDAEEEANIDANDDADVDADE